MATPSSEPTVPPPPSFAAPPGVPATSGTQPGRGGKHLNSRPIGVVAMVGLLVGALIAGGIAVVAVSSANSKTSRARGQITAAQSSAAAAQASVDALQASVGSLQASASALQSQVEQAQASANAAAQASVASARASVAGQARQVVAAQASLSTAQRAFASREAGAHANDFAGEGTYLVGHDIQPGTYQAPASSNCYWARLASGDTSDIINNDIANGPVVVTIVASDFAFLATRCGEFHKIG